MGQIVHDTITEFETYEELDRLVIEGAEESPEVKLGGPFFTDFEDDTIGNDPAGFTDISGVWAVQDDSGNKVLKNSGDGLIRAISHGIRDNFILKFKVRFVSGTYNRWLVYPRFIDTNNQIFIGCHNGNDVIDIYETVGGVVTRVAYSAYVYGTGWHNVTIICQDACIVVTIGTTTIKYESLSVLKNTVGTIFRAHSGSINAFDDVDFVDTYHPCGKLVSNVLPAQNLDLSLAWSREQNEIHGDNFNDGEVDTQWSVNMGGVTGAVFDETGGELKYSGTPAGNGYVAIYTPYTGKRHSWYQEIEFKAPTAIAVGKEILFRMDSDAKNFVEISIQADGYRVEKVENGAQPGGSVTDPVALIGNENTTFHTLKILWDEVNDKVYGWIDNLYIGTLSVDTSTFPDQQRFILHMNNTNGSAIDRRFDDLVLPGSQVQVLARTGPVDPTDETWEEWKPSENTIIVDACDDAADWATSDAVNFAKAQETTIKQEGTGSLKVVATTSAKNAYCDIDLSALDLSEKSYLSFWIRSDRVGKYLQMQIGESDLAGAGAAPMIYDIDIRAANTWQQEFWDLSRISSELRNAVVYVCLKCISASTAFTCYLDDIKADAFLTGYEGAEPGCSNNQYAQYMLVLTDGGVATPALSSFTVTAYEAGGGEYLAGFMTLCKPRGEFLYGVLSLMGTSSEFLGGRIDVVWKTEEWLRGYGDLVYSKEEYLQGILTLVPYVCKPTIGKVLIRLNSVLEEVG